MIQDVFDTMNRICVYRGGQHVVYHNVNRGYHEVRDMKGDLLWTEKCWHRAEESCPAVVKIEQLSTMKGSKKE